MKGLVQFIFSICLIFPGILILSSCNKALHNVGRTAFPDQQIEIKETSPGMKFWQTDHLTIQYQLTDTGSSLVISGVVKIKDRVTLTYPITDFLNIYVNLLDQRGVATSRHDIGPVLAHYSTVPDQIHFSKTVQKEEDTSSIAFSYWGNFREKGFAGRIEVAELEIFYNPFAKRE